MKTIKIAPRTLEVLHEHNIPVGVYNQLDKYEKIAVSTQLRRWGRVSTGYLQESLMWARLKYTGAAE